MTPYFCNVKRILAVVLLICLHVQPALHSYQWAEYVINFDYIATVLCINKEEPQLNCDGTCYLAQQLKKQQSQQEQELPQITHFKFECILPLIKDQEYAVMATMCGNPQMLPDLYTFNYSSTLIEPPRIIG